MEFLTTNLTTNVRFATWQGEQYIVAPMTSIVTGVLHGSKGSLFYPQEETTRNIGSWDGVPLTAYHPSDPMTNQPLSAREKGVIDRQGIGWVRNTKWKGKLVHEGWFNVAKTKKVDNRIYEALVKNKPMELSTGLYTENEVAPPNANYNGKSYDYIARDYRPDHVAILPDQIGACSVNDGCGLNINQRGKTMPVTNAQSCKMCGGGLVENDSNGMCAGCSKNLRGITSNKTTLGIALNAICKELGITLNDSPQPRHPKTQQYQGKFPNAARKGYTDTGKNIQPTEIEGPVKGADGKVEDDDYTGTDVDSLLGGMGDSVEKNADYNDAGSPLTGYINNEDEDDDEESENVTINDDDEDDEDEEGDEGMDAVANKNNTKTSECPSCGGKVMDGECQSCNYIQNTQVAPTNNQLWITYNRDWPQAKRDNLDDKDFAGPDQSFPISTQEDVDSAAKLTGHADNPSAVKSKIKSIAKRKGLDVPDSYKEPTDNGGPGSGRRKGGAKSNTNIASQHLGISSLAPKNSDREDFHDVSVGGVKRALEAAHGGPQSPERDAAVASAAKTHLGIGNLKTQGSDRLDFHQVHVGGLNKAMNAVRESSPTTNEFASDEQRIGFFANGPGKGASQKTADAFAASKHAKSTKSAGAHKKAANKHLEAADDESDNGNDEMARGHRSAASYHQRQAMNISKKVTSNNSNEEEDMSLVVNDFSSDEARKAAFAHMEEAGTYNPKTASAAKASAHAEKTGTAGAHRKAAMAHTSAAAHHQDKADYEGNKASGKLAEAHEAAANFHTKAAAKAAKAKMTANMKQIIENCTCEVTKNALIATLNEKPDSSNADLIGDDDGTGYFVGGKDPTYEDDDDDMPDKAQKGTMAPKNKITGNSQARQLTTNQVDSLTQQLFGCSASEAKEIITNKKMELQQQKRGLLKQLVSNARTPELRKELLEVYAPLSIPKLQALVASIPRPTNNQISPEQLISISERDGPNLYLGANSPTFNSGEMVDNEGEQDTLDIPVANYKEFSEEQRAQCGGLRQKVG
jgi:hypothetical protein